MSTLLPDEKATIATYDKIAEEWAGMHHIEGFWRTEMQRFYKLLPVGKILEVGSGGARDAKELIDFGYEYVGTDVSDSLLKIARQNLPDAKFVKQSVYQLDFPKKFDGFWCSAVLFHVPKIRIAQALKQIKSVVKPGAIGFISIKDGEGEGLELETWNDGSRHKRYFAYYSKAEFSEILAQNGYQVIDYMYRPDSAKTRWHCFCVRTQ